MKDDKEQAHDAERKAAKKRMAESGRRNIVAFNASRDGRPAMRHAVHSTIANGEVPEQIPGAQEITSRVDDRIAQFISDLGGEDSVTEGQRTILAALRVNLLVLE